MAHADRVAFLRIGVQVKHRRSRRLHYCAGESTLISALGISVRLLNQDVILELIHTHSRKFTVEEVVLGLTVRLTICSQEERCLVHTIDKGGFRY